MRTDLPTGTVTFFFSDMEGSTRLVQELGEAWPDVLETHDRLIRAAIESHDGVEVRTIGDAFFVAFGSAADAVATAAEVQRLMAAETWPDGRTVRVRLGVHTGLGALGGSDYIGIDVHRAARISDAAHGGQVVMSEATALLVEGGLPDGTSMRDLGKHRLKDLLDKEALYQLVIDGVSEEFPPLRSLEAVPNNLPVQVTSFVGREEEVARALEFLDASRILTLLGPGGTGKSRLSLQIAAEAADEFPDGLYFVPLASVTDGDLIASTILGSLGVQVASGGLSPRDQLKRFLADKELLLVLDNFEQLVTSAEIVPELAAASPRSKFLVTSRIPLRVSGEQEMPIPPLDMADPTSDLQTLTQSGSIHLFIERAQAVRPDFEVTRDNAASVAKLVNRLDGLPLAIELVVPKLKLLAVDAILERLDTRSLAGGVRDAPERHQTLWNAISWSVDTLPDQARRLFVHFSVFAGGGRLAEVESVCAATAGVDVLDALATLVDHSLVVRDGEDRFRMLQVIREYASEMLTESGEADEVQDRHAEAYLKRIEEAFPELTGKDRRVWLESLDRDHDNFRAAISYSVRVEDVDRALRFAWSMWRYWQIRGHLHEARHRVEEVLVLPGGELRLRAKAVEALGSIAWWQGDIDACEEAYREALRMQREGGDDREIANALYNKGLVHALFREDPDGGDEILKEALAIYERLGDPGGLADVHWGLANVSIFGHEEPRAGVAHLEDSIAGYRQVGNVFGEGWAQFEMGEAHRRLEEVDTAWEHYCAGLRLLYGSGDISATVLFLMGFAAMALGSGDRDRAVRLAGAAWAFGDRSGIDLISIRANRVEGLERETLEELDGDLAAAYQEGRRLSYDEAVAYALGKS